MQSFVQMSYAMLAEAEQACQCVSMVVTHSHTSNAAIVSAAWVRALSLTDIHILSEITQQARITSGLNLEPVHITLQSLYPSRYGQVHRNCQVLNQSRVSPCRSLAQVLLNLSCL